VSHAGTPDNSPCGLANADIAESPNRSGLLEILPRSSQDAPTLKEDWSLVAELMHHFCTVTCNTLSLREDARHVWRVVIPTEGYLNKYLAAGLKEDFRELISSPIDPNNWQPVFCFASMISVHLSTAPIRFSVDRWPTPLSNMIEIFASVKGFQEIMKPFLGSLQRTQLAPLVDSIWIENEMCIPR